MGRRNRSATSSSYSSSESEEGEFSDSSSGEYSDRKSKKERNHERRRSRHDSGSDTDRDDDKLRRGRDENGGKDSDAHDDRKERRSGRSERELELEKHGDTRSEFEDRYRIEEHVVVKDERRRRESGRRRSERDDGENKRRRNEDREGNDSDKKSDIRDRERGTRRDGRERDSRRRGERDDGEGKGHRNDEDSDRRDMERGMQGDDGEKYSRRKDERDDGEHKRHWNEDSDGDLKDQRRDMGRVLRKEDKEKHSRRRDEHGNSEDKMHRNENRDEGSDSDRKQSRRDREMGTRRDDREKDNRRRGERSNGDDKRRRNEDRNEGSDGDRKGRKRDRERGKRRDDREKDNSRRDDRREEERKDVNKGVDGLKGNEQPKAAVVQKEENLGRSGGVYIPPFKLARMMKEVQDKSSLEYQRMTWDALRKSINGLVNKVNATNIKNIIPELFAENLIRGRGLFCRSCMKSQMASPGFTDVFAALVAVANTKFPELGELLVKRIILQLQRAYKRNDKPQLLAAVKFIAHLVNQQVVHELIALEFLFILLENPTDDSVEVAVGLVTECGSMLQDLCPKGLHGVFERFRGILHEGEIDRRVQFLIEGLFALRKAKFQGYPAVRPELDLVEQEDQLTHEISLQDQIDPEIALDIFKPDPNFLENEKKYEELKKSILGEESEDEADSDEGPEDEDEDEDEDESDEEDEEQMQIKDETETNLINLRRTIYLTIMSSVDFEEAGHKLLKIKLEPGQEMELCIMLLECCSQERTYLRYYGLLGQRFCMINKVHQENFEKCFVQQYSMIHRLETNKLRNVAKFFAHLLGTDALPWHVLSYIRLTEEDTTSSSRIFIKILFQELSEHLGIRLLNERLNDPSMQESFESIFPKDNPKNTRFAINFFTSIGLGGITENLRDYLKNMPRLIMQQQKLDSGSSVSDGSDASESESSSSSDGSESDSGSDIERRKRRRRK